MSDIIEQARALVRGIFSRRSQAYSRVFDTVDDPRGDRQAVLDDLMKFCHFDKGVYHHDQRMTDVLIGRQEVLHRIFDYAGLDTAALYQKYNAEKFNPRKIEE
ncbi:hypothetical protein LGH82_33205 [Mesorhizobium sp. PAMC28654]|uniref:Bbp19 family protein n=1 Tax=Mesorhizobium sp. PAMC28654 TaxID=2880934 RepID=UPI001D0A0FA9|nr:hypothetical protein [Mesorhizobium sp. PAMC28654]UDL89838.1 hypothetical protein LGH82_33205 [Mesorhizobium sp. PAMC28654]